MKTIGMGGTTTLSKTLGTVTISTSHLTDYRKLLRRLTAASRTVNDATHAEFAFPDTPTTKTSKVVKSLRALRATEKLRLKVLT
jgi:hypothetical protein